MSEKFLDDEPIKWSKSLSVGYPMIDKHHRHLVKLTARLHLMICKGDNRTEELEKLAVGLRNYTIYHFSAEEKLMQAAHCPLYATHKLEHDKFVKEIDSVFEPLIKGDVAVKYDIYKFLSEWLINHIAVSDKRWAIWMHSASKTAQAVRS